METAPAKVGAGEGSKINLSGTSKPISKSSLQQQPFGGLGGSAANPANPPSIPASMLKAGASGGNGGRAGNSNTANHTNSNSGGSKHVSKAARKRAAAAGKKLESRDGLMDTLNHGYYRGQDSYQLPGHGDYHSMGKQNMGNYMQGQQFRQMMPQGMMHNDMQMMHRQQNNSPLPAHMQQHHMNHNYLNMMHPAAGIPPQMAGMIPGMLPNGMMMGPGMPQSMMMMHMQQFPNSMPGPGGVSGEMSMSVHEFPAADHQHYRRGHSQSYGLQHQLYMPQHQERGGLDQINHHQHAQHQHQQHRYNHGNQQGFPYKNQSDSGPRVPQSHKSNQEMRTDDMMRASSPMLTRMLVDMLREGDAGKARAWRFFERLCTAGKADVYQHSVMLNACNDSFAAEKLMQRMEASGIEPSEVTYQKLYKIYLRDARVEEADEVLKKMRQLMQADGATGLPADYTNRVLTDMLLEMVKEGNQAEERAWVLFNRLRSTSQVNVIHYNVMLNTCKTTSQALQLVKQARDSGIAPSDRTCLKLAKMYIKEGNMPSHPGQLDAVCKGLKKTTLFSSSAGNTAAAAAAAAAAADGEAAALEVESREFVPGVPFSSADGANGLTAEVGEATVSTEVEVARMLEHLLVQQDSDGRGRGRAGAAGGVKSDALVQLPEAKCASP